VGKDVSDLVLPLTLKGSVVKIPVMEKFASTVSIPVRHWRGLGISTTESKPPTTELKLQPWVSPYYRVI
jgi:hypothetical protein